MLSTEDYTKIVEGFRQCGAPNVSKVAGIVGFSRDTVEKALKVGWPKRNLSPIKDLDIWSQSDTPASGELGTQKVSSAAQSLPRQNATLHNAPTSTRSGQNATVEYELGQNATEGGARQTLGRDPSNALNSAPRQTKDVAGRQDEDRAPANTSKTWQEEDETLSHARKLAKGVVISIMNLLGNYQAEIAAMGEELKFNRANGNKESRPASTLKAMGKIVAMAPKAIAMQKALMDADRQHVGAPQNISELRITNSDEDGEGATPAARLDRLLPVARTHTGRVIDIEAVPYSGEESTDKGSV